MTPERTVLRYPGSSIRPAVGDRVRHLTEPPEDMMVEEVIDTRERMARWGVDEPGLVLAGGALGTVFEPLTELSEVIFVSRGEGGGPPAPGGQDGPARPTKGEGERV